MWEDILQPADLLLPEDISSIGQTMMMHDANGLPDVKACRLALIGLPDANGEHQAANAIRQQLYTLQKGAWDFDFADLGNVPAGRDHVDTLVAIEDVAKELIQRQCIPIFIGGQSQDALGLYRAYASLEQLVNMAVISSGIAMGDDHQAADASNWLTHVLMSKPYHLFHLACLAYQTYFVPEETLTIMEKMHFEALRIGQIKGTMAAAEPLLRDMDIIVADNASMGSVDAPGQISPNPNGLSSVDFCQAMRYAGMSDKSSSLMLTGYHPTLDPHGHNAMALAQGIWYIAEGIQWRKGDYPHRPVKDYLKFTVWLEGDEGHEMVFYKSPLSERWWMVVPASPSESARKSMIPCSHEDYLQALKGDLPDRWWKASRRAI